MPSCLEQTAGIPFIKSGPNSGPSEETFSNPLSVFGRICWPECLVSLAQLDNDNILSWVVSGGGGWWLHSRP